jgi:hypothetical protein
MSHRSDVDDVHRHDGVHGPDLIDRSRADLHQPRVPDIHVG